jgi:dolichyl-phosphate-mannose-protein mannosyltransferase
MSRAGRDDSSSTAVVAGRRPRSGVRQETAEETRAGLAIAPREWAGVLAVVLLAVGGSMAVAYSSGAIHAAYGDDWSYSRVALHLYETGDIQLTGWGPMTLVGHLLWAYPFMAIFGPSLEVLHWSTAVAGAIGLLAAFAVLRRLLPPRLALFGTAVVAMVPAYGILTTSYMTDITGFAAQMVCLALGLAALDAKGKRRLALLAGSLAVGVLAFAVRDTGIAAPIAVLVSHLIAARRRGVSLPHVLWPLAVLLVSAVAVLAWRRGFSGLETFYGNGKLSGRSVFALGQGYFALALALLPALAIGARPLWRERFRPASAAGTAAGCAVAALVVLWEIRHHEPLQLPSGEYFGRSFRPGSEVALADLPPAFLPGAVWAAIDLLALLGGVLLAISLARVARAALERSRWRHADGAILVVVIYGALYGAALIYNTATGGPLFERHLLPLAVPLLVVLLWVFRSRGVPRSARLTAAATFAVLAALSVVSVVHETAYRGAEWKVGEEAVAGGTPVADVDAGLAWVGFHAKGRVHWGSRTPSRRWTRPTPWYAFLFRDSGNCLSTSAVALSAPELRLVGVHEFRWVPGLGRRRIWLYRNPAAC